MLNCIRSYQEDYTQLLNTITLSLRSHNLRIIIVCIHASYKLRGSLYFLYCTEKGEEVAIVLRHMSLTSISSFNGHHMNAM